MNSTITVMASTKPSMNMTDEELDKLSLWSEGIEGIQFINKLVQNTTSCYNKKDYYYLRRIKI